MGSEPVTNEYRHPAAPPLSPPLAPRLRQRRSSLLDFLDMARILVNIGPALTFFFVFFFLFLPIFLHLIVYLYTCTSYESAE